MSTSVPSESNRATAIDEGRRPLRRALVSVYDKTALETLARALHEAGVEIVSTGGSARLIADLGLPVTAVEQLTGFPECLEGRVKTLHPRVHAGILADTHKAEHLQQLRELEIEPFDVVVSNLYPFTETVASGADTDACIEQIDIGGPSMVRAAAKNHGSVAIITSPQQYPALQAALSEGGFTAVQRRVLAAEAFARTAAYDVAVAGWMADLPEVAEAGADVADGLGDPRDQRAASWTRRATLRYGENPHQSAALFTADQTGGPGLAQAEHLHGKEMSFNNYVDADAAHRAAYDHGDSPTVAIIKHANPCGIAVGSDIAEAHRKAHACDPTSAYGGVIATNAPVTAEMAAAVADIFTEVVVAPDFEVDALDILTRKKNLRLVRAAAPTSTVETRAISGGLLVQEIDRVDAVITDADGAITGGDAFDTWRLVAGAPADAATVADLQFAWRAVRAVKSNAILLADDQASVGVGMGQVNRVDSSRLAVQRAGVERARGAVAASDAFFPFADGLQVLLDAGVRAVVAPGGSKRDDEVIAAAEAAGVTLYFTGTRHFAH